MLRNNQRIIKILFLFIALFCFMTKVEAITDKWGEASIPTPKAVHYNDTLKKINKFDDSHGVGVDGPTLDEFDKKVSCESLSEIIDFAHKVFTYICIGMGVGLVILGMFDFVKAVTQSDQDAMKKATKRFTNRIFIMIIMLILPALIEWILTATGLVEKSCIGFF